MSVTSTIRDNLRRLHKRIAAASKKAGRDPNEITLVAVSKFASSDAVRAAYEAGCRDFGENRIQECAEKIRALTQELPDSRWHMIGHLQTNKVKKSLELFDMIQSLDSLRLAEEINRRAAEAGRKIDVLIEVNSSGEAQKHGLAPVEIPELISRVIQLPELKLRGIMTLGPHTEDQDKIRRAFSLTRELFENFSKSYKSDNDSSDLPAVLSMGMTADFELAIAEGATALRVGTAIFGPRIYSREI